ncbi:Uncharacterised protein [Clostridioides difficile]|nr:Uncharacterised protein [Clostridioides difficile]
MCFILTKWYVKNTPKWFYQAFEEGFILTKWYVKTA